ncbi:outer membrane beta-barrel protein [Pollutibacter soli]|uniref:outer membrane beta-barrel protein n=1 Tax=Pollutibacter soli TaxID=3034157 RepID=UPI00301345F3
MRKTFLPLLLFFITALQAHAQLEKKSWMAGGSAGFDFDYSNPSAGSTSKGFIFSLSPSAGYFIMDKLAVGLKLSSAYSQSSYIDPVTPEQKTKFLYLRVGTFARYYFLKPDAKVNLIVEPAIFYSNSFNLDQGSNTSGFEYGVGGGPVFFLNKSLSLELILKWLKVHYSDRFTYNEINAEIGLQIYFPNKK